MSDFEEKDALANAAFDKFMAERKILLSNEATREIFFEIFIGGMDFMIKQLLKEMTGARHEH